MSETLLVLGWAVLCLPSCTRWSDGGSEGSSVSSNRVAWVPRDSLHQPDAWFRLYRGDGFTVVVPRNARVTEDKTPLAGATTVAFDGPDIEVGGKWSHNVDTVFREGPGYSLSMTSIPNVNHRSLQQVEDSVMHAYNDGLTPEDVSGPADSSSGVIAGQRVIVISPSCGDCAATDVYFVSRDRIVVCSWHADDNDLLMDLSRPLYWYILSTFRWDSVNSRTGKLSTPRIDSPVLRESAARRAP